VRGARCAGSGRGAHTPSTTRVRRAHSTWPRSAGAEMHCTRLLKPFCRQTVSAAATGAHPLTACGAGVPAQPTSVSRPSPGCRAGRRRGTQADAPAAQVPEPGPGGGQWQSGQPGCGRGTHGALRGQQHRVLQEQEPGLADSSMLLFTVMKAPSPWARRLRLVVCSSWAAACSLLRRNQLPVRELRLSAGLGRTGAAGRVRERAHPRRAVHDAGRPARADHGGHVRASFPAHTSHQPPPCGALHRLRAVACVRTPYSQGGAPCPTRSPLSSLAAGTQHCSTLPQAGSARARR